MLCAFKLEKNGVGEAAKYVGDKPLNLFPSRKRKKQADGKPFI